MFNTESLAVTSSRSLRLCMIDIMHQVIFYFGILFTVFDFGMALIINLRLIDLNKDNRLLKLVY